MKFENKTVTSTPEILKRKTGGELLVPMAITAFTSEVTEVKAGNLINEDGEIATTTSGESDAIGILINDVTVDNPNGSILRAFGTVNVAVAQAHSGHTITDAEKAALPNIIFD